MTLKHATLRQLKVFETVARKLSFSRAASELHLTQPAVSMQVKLLESQAGLPLFEQIGKRIHLTEAGQELYRRSLAVADELRAAEESLNSLRGLEQGRLHVALVSTATYFAPPLLARFLKTHPGVTAKLSVDNRETVLAQLAANEIDFAITGHPPEHLDTVAEAFAPHPHVIVAHPAHVLAGKRRIPLKRVAAETFVMREPGSGTRGLLERLFAGHALPLKVNMEMASNESIKQAVMAEMGVAFLSLHTVGLELATGRLATLDVQGLPIVRHWYVVHLAQKRLSPIALALKEFLRQEAGTFLAGWGTRHPAGAAAASALYNFGGPASSG
ncbi:MAG: transcriptional regulator [Betaproteobacteria bacterium RIFCSPLOWO2_12_FULL_65_110]|nr:MAG: transcriptional regulator [Betaproteobacteria bacterium RIFCSPLOWO2_02_FULL_65_20]OGA37610.1 MAG: transcriptional regulator [Betaproteobacteria bacterium RIFCSPLOWO2_12_FULL_65_110]